MKRAYLLGALFCVACSSSTGSYSLGHIEDRPPTPRLASAAVAPHAEADTTNRPALLKRKRKRLRPPTEHHLTNGVRVLLLERHEFPSVSASFVLDRGSAAAPPGVAALYAEALEGDSAEFPAKEASEFLHYVGASTSTWAARDGVGIRLTVLSPLLDGALVRVSAMFTSPLLGGEELARARTDAAAAATRGRESPSSIAGQTLRAMVLGQNHPYAVPVYAGSQARYANMSRNELENFRNMFGVPERMTVAFVGDFKPDKVLARLEHRLGKLPRRKASEPPSAAQPSTPSKPRIVVIPRKGASQSNVAIGFLGAPRASEDHAALAVLETLLGRALSGRLDLKIRGEHGFTYGVEMNAPSWRSAGVIEIKAAVEASHTADAVKGLLGELARVGAQPIEPEELMRAKMYAISELGDVEPSASGFDLAMLETLAIENLPLDWHEKVATRVESLEETDVRAAATRFFTTNAAQIAIVGDPDVIVEPLRALGIGDVTVGAPF